jgi:hypothetical protein
MKLRTKSIQSLRTHPMFAHRTTAAPIVLPAQRSEVADAYTWAVNAALESGQTELAYEIAAGYPA